MRRKFKHALQVGMGVKLPTGSYTAQNNGTVLLANMQPGTGAYDVPFNALYTFRLKKAGINAELNYTLTTPNPKRYRYGNKTTAVLRFFYWHNTKKATFLPHAGISYEHLAKDVSLGEVQKYTGGRRFDAVAGLDVYIKSFAIGVGVKQPLNYNLGNGQIKPKTNFTASIIYLF